MFWSNTDYILRISSRTKNANEVGTGAEKEDRTTAPYFVTNLFLQDLKTDTQSVSVTTRRTPFTPHTLLAATTGNNYPTDERDTQQRLPHTPSAATPGTNCPTDEK